MLIKFSSPCYSDITMFGDVATALIKMMGHSGTVPGAILAEQVPAALSKLEAGLKHIATQSEQSTPNDKDNPEDREEPISLANRAFPLVEMLKAAAQQNCNVMWNK